MLFQGLTGTGIGALLSFSAITTFAAVISHREWPKYAASSPVSVLISISQLGFSSSNPSYNRERCVKIPIHIERSWGILENHWSGTLLNSIEITLEWAKTMTWKGLNPVVKLLETTYEKGVSVCKKMFKVIARRLDRHAELCKYYVTIYPQVG